METAVSTTVGALRDVACQGMTNAEDLLAEDESSRGGAWRHLEGVFHRSGGGEEIVATRYQPVVSMKEYEHLCVLARQDLENKRYGGSGMRPYVLKLSQLEFTNVPDGGTNYVLEFRLGVQGQTVCVRTSTDKHVPVSTGFRNDDYQVASISMRCARGQTVAVNRTWNLDWRGHYADLHREFLEIIIYQKNYFIIQEEVGRHRIILDELINSTLAQNINIPPLKKKLTKPIRQPAETDTNDFTGITSANTAVGSGNGLNDNDVMLASDDHCFKLSFVADFSELFTFQIGLGQCSIDLRNCVTGEIQRYESYKVLLSCRKKEGYFPYQDGEWFPTKSAIIHKECPTLLEYDEPGQLLWRGTLQTFSYMDIVLTLQAKPRAGKWESFAYSVFPCYRFLNVEKESFSNVIMKKGGHETGGGLPSPSGSMRSPESSPGVRDKGQTRRLSETSGLPVLSGTIGVPLKPTFTQKLGDMDTGKAPAHLAVKIQSFSGINLSVTGPIYYTIALIDSPLPPGCMLPGCMLPGSMLRGSSPATLAGETPVGRESPTRGVQEEFIVAHSPITRSSNVALRNIPTALFSNKPRRRLLLRNNHPSTSPDESLVPLINKGAVPDPDDVIALQQWLEKHSIVICLWSGSDSPPNTTEGAVPREVFSSEAFHTVRKPLGHCTLRLIDVVNTICNLRPGSGRAVMDLPIRLLKQGSDTARAGIDLRLALSMHPVPKCAGFQVRHISLNPAPTNSTYCLTNEFGRTQSLFSALTLHSLPNVAQKLSPYDLGRSVRLQNRNNDFFLNPSTCAYTGYGNQRDIAILVTAIGL
ncbi:hypothetical protein GNI_040660 [Gregarina niphandrodes]|uniref:Uncharacterized protein n=1 Tax=Gregarina niphandrodes TaxID=110365 RepID=A0A023BAE1_GRENI|nr:hypothetical protein GNI_040660 [Gregarina niphandrodes]EZG78164.1 hypothetical protein GNI_040660 [Gregarina niphandrodes]|eukprot:XP_011129450.1 hypothetical protein GNI_040660 [Gregarina niphandrodes]